MFLPQHKQLAQAFYLLVGAELVVVLGIDVYNVMQVLTRAPMLPVSHVHCARAVLNATACVGGWVWIWWCGCGWEEGCESGTKHNKALCLQVHATVGTAGSTNVTNSSAAAAAAKRSGGGGAAQGDDGEGLSKEPNMTVAVFSLFVNLILHVGCLFCARFKCVCVCVCV
jgi:hypothetical protein